MQKVVNMKEAQADLWFERAMDRLDRDYMRGVYNDKEYQERFNALVVKADKIERGES